MMAKIIIPSSLKKHTDDKTVVVSNGNTLYEVLNNLCDQYPDIKPYVLTTKGKICTFMGIYINENLVRDLATAISAENEILLVPAVAGG